MDAVRWAVLAMVLPGLSACTCSGKQEAPAASPQSATPSTPMSAAPPGSARKPPPLPVPLPGRRRDVTSIVGGALKAAVGDVDGDGRRELILAGDDRLRVVTDDGRELAQVPAPGSIQVLAAADLDGDGRAEILAGWGSTRQTPPERASVYRLSKGKLVEEVLPLPPSTRQEMVAVLPAGKSRLLVAGFESKYMVRSSLAELTQGQWSLRDLGLIRMATSFARGDVRGGGTEDIVVGRVYGDSTGADGDAFLLAPDGGRIPVPTTRGVRGLAVADTDGDGQGEIFLGDGWDQNYGAKARGLLTWVRWQDGAFHSELIEDTPGQYTIWSIVPADVDGDGRPEIVTRGTEYVRVFRRKGTAWTALTIAGKCRDVVAGDLDGVAGDEILILGERSEIVSLNAAIWPE